VPIRTIARQVGRSEDAVSERRRTIGLPARPRSRPWSPRQDQLLRAASAAGLPAAALASRLDRPAEQVRRRRRALLGPARTPRAYTPTDDDAIRARWNRDSSWQRQGDLEQLARDLERSPGSIRLRAQKLGLHQPLRRQRWRGYEDAAVRDGYERGLPCARIAAQLPGRSASAIAARAAKLGLATYARIWTARDDLVLRALTRDGQALERTAQLLGRTPDALRARARKLALAPLRSHRSYQASRRWTPTEDEQLRLHPGLNPATLAERLDRTPEAVTRRLRQLGLRDARARSPHHRVPTRNGFTPGERATVKRELRTGGPRRQLALAQRLGKPPADIRALATIARGWPVTTTSVNPTRAYFKCLACKTRRYSRTSQADPIGDLCAVCGSLLEPVGDLAEIVGYRAVETRGSTSPFDRRG
jgi:hypothetical protein